MGTHKQKVEMTPTAAEPFATTLKVDPGPHRRVDMTTWLVLLFSREMSMPPPDEGVTRDALPAARNPARLCYFAPRDEDSARTVVRVELAIGEQVGVLISSAFLSAQ
jgi:hypothetical protein